jgi:hypothetical protein
LTALVCLVVCALVPTPRSYYPVGQDAYNGCIDPTGTTDLMQFASCPGPDELINCRSTPQYFGYYNAPVTLPVGLEMITSKPIRKNEQFCHWYGPEWFSGRGMKRRNVGTDKYPAPRRAPRKPRTSSAKASTIKAAPLAIRRDTNHGIAKN